MIPFLFLFGTRVVRTTFRSSGGSVAGEKTVVSPAGTLWEWNRDQIRKGGIKLKNSVSGIAISRVARANVSGGSVKPARIHAGNSERIPQKTKNIPVSNRMEMIVSSMSPVETGKLSRLSSCMNGDNRIITTMSTSTSLGNLWSIVFDQNERITLPL